MPDVVASSVIACSKRLKIYDFVVVAVVPHIQRISCQPEKTTSHGGLSRSWSAEQRKENKRKRLLAYSAPPPPPPILLVRRKTNKKIIRRIYRRYVGLGRSRVRTRISSARRLGTWVWLRKCYTPVFDNKFPSLVASLFSWRCLAASTSFFPPRGHEPPPTLCDRLNPHLSL